jgi:hypothetical protein
VLVSRRGPCEAPAVRALGLSLMIALACGVGCNGGPISDFPRAGGPPGAIGNDPPNAGPPASPGGGATGSGDAAGGPGAGGAPGATSGGATTGGAEPSAPGGSTGGAAGGGTTGGGTTGGGITGGGITGGGTPGGGTPGGFLGGGDAGAASDAGASQSDAGIDAGAPEDSGPGEVDAGDGSVESGSPAADAGLCSTDAFARVDGGCQGSYCGMTLAVLGEEAGSGACSGATALRLACDGQLAGKTARCAQDHALSLALGSSVRGCLARDPLLASVEGGCLDCYVSELLCTLSNCLATCVAGFETACTSCRRESCGAEFRRCSGLPAL